MAQSHDDYVADLQARIVALVSGNRGAISAIMRTLEETGVAPSILLPILEKHAIKGEHIWILFKDRSDYDPHKFLALLISEPDNLRELADR